jgi:type I restriction enzyme S subunit
MEVRKGYKQTEVGEIPQDWIPTPISKIASVRGRVGWKGYTKKDLVQQGPLTIGATQINKNNRLDLSNPTFLSREKYLESPEIMVEYKDILIVQRGSTIGKLVLIDQEIGEATINPSLVIVRTQKISPGFVAYYLLSAAGQKQILTDLSSTGVPMISQRQIGNFLVPLPPTLAEQEAIAEALSDADALIESLETLLAKKRQVKQGAMSELLTGKRRVVESGEWKVKKLGELLDFERPDKYIVESTEYLENGSVPVLTANKSFVLGYTDEEFGIYENLPVIIFDDFTTDKKFVDFPFKVKSSAIKILKPKSNKINLRYIFERMQLIRFSLGDHKRYYISEYQHIQIEMPSLAEQTAIAEILSDMDAEIRALEEKLSKARAVKAGMMSALLTGRVRLV